MFVDCWLCHFACSQRVLGDMKDRSMGVPPAVVVAPVGRAGLANMNTYEIVKNVEETVCPAAGTVRNLASWQGFVRGLCLCSSHVHVDCRVCRSEFRIPKND